MERGKGKLAEKVPKQRKKYLFYKGIFDFIFVRCKGTAIVKTFQYDF